MSKDEQRKRFLARIDGRDTSWKLTAADLRERQSWKAYRRAYEQSLAATSTADAPWFVVPADDKPTARLIVSQTIIQTLERLKMTYPEVTPERETELAAARRTLEA